MKNITRIFVVCAALFACSSLFGAPATGKGHHHKGYHQSGIIGQVDGGFPVHVLVMSKHGQYITDFSTTTDGSFEVYLKPGTYVLVAYIVVGPLPSPESLPPELVFGTPVTVTVEKKQFELVVVPFPSGPIPAL